MPKADLKTLHALLRGSYPAKWDENTDQAAKLTLTSMLSEFGPERTHAAVVAFTQREQWWNPSVLRTYVPRVGEFTRETCPKCSGANPGPGFVIGKATDKDGIEYECVQSCKHGAE